MWVPGAAERRPQARPREDRKDLPGGDCAAALRDVQEKGIDTCSGAGCGNVSICANGKRTCYIDHCNGECTKKKAALATFDLCCISVAFRFILDLGITLAREFP